MNKKTQEALNMIKVLRSARKKAEKTNESIHRVVEFEQYYASVVWVEITQRHLWFQVCHIDHPNHPATTFDIDSTVINLVDDTFPFCFPRVERGFFKVDNRVRYFLEYDCTSIKVPEGVAEEIAEEVIQGLNPGILIDYLDDNGYKIRS